MSSATAVVGAPRRRSSTAINIPSTNPNVSGCRGCSCNCECKNCLCWDLVDANDANQETYGGEGTFLVIGTQTIQASSYATASSMASVQESSNAPAPFAAANTRAPPPSFDDIRSILGHQDAAQLVTGKLKRYLEESDKECPWRDSLGESVTSNAMMEEEEAGLFGPIDLDGSSMVNNPLSSGERSMLSSFMSSLQAPSVGMSDVVRNTGTRFPSRRGSDWEKENCYLRLN